MKEILEKYKYHIIGSLIILIPLFIYYNYNKDKTNQPDEIKKITNGKIDINNINNEKNMILLINTLQKEVQKSTKLIIHSMNKNKKNINEEFKKKLFNKDIYKKNIIIDSNSASTNNGDDEYRHSDYVINFGDNGKPEVYKNVIGFRLIKCTIPNTLYTITAGQTIVVALDDGLGNPVNTKVIPLDSIVGDHSFIEVAEEIENLIFTNMGINITITPIDTTLKYDFSGDLFFMFNDDGFTSEAKRLLGFEGDKTGSESINGLRSDIQVLHSRHAVDLIIPEIPNIACKISPEGNNIIDRIPMITPHGSLNFYRPPEGELETHNYFYPIKLNSLSIKLHNADTGLIYPTTGLHTTFEFELTIVENTKYFT